MEHETEGLIDQIGSALGMDNRRVQGDLERFKELIESPRRDTAPGAARRPRRAGPLAVAGAVRGVGAA